MEYENILIDQNQAVLHVTINRPKQLNALNAQTISELNNALVEAENDKETKCIVITGSGQKAFVAGADIKEFMFFNKKQGEDLARNGQKKLFDLIENLSKPVIAMINGFALGGGLELALSCHMRYATQNAKMGLPEVSLGVIPGYGGTQRLPKIIGRGRASEMIVTGGMIDAEQAKNYGLVNDVFKQEEVGQELEKITRKILKNSPMAISKALKSIKAAFGGVDNGFEVEKKEFGSCFESSEFLEGTKAFIEKRKPKF